MLLEIEAARERERARRGRPPIRRIAAAALVACLIVGAVAVVATSASARRQLALSFTRQPAEYLEISFAAPLARIDSAGGAASVRVPVRLHAHAEALRDQAVVLEVAGAGRTVTRRRTIDLAAGEARTVVLSAPIPAGSARWEISVALPGRAERLHFTSPTTSPGG